MVHERCGLFDRMANNHALNNWEDTKMPLNTKIRARKRRNFNHTVTLQFFFVTFETLTIGPNSLHNGAASRPQPFYDNKEP